ncbi:MAG: prolyl oligopeptidase family serine peptidase [Gammaproteobacteria bacterium]|nr:prolyl oligopeptidase family serine peptidase [Gammaproteobacteria bacterium]
MGLVKRAHSNGSNSHRQSGGISVTSCISIASLVVLITANTTIAADGEIASPPGAMELTNVPVVSAALTTDVGRYQNVRSAGVVNWVGERLLIVTRFGDTSQIHLVSSPLGMREQITFADEPIGGALIPPLAEPKQIIYSKDVGGSESYQLFLMDLESRTSELLSDGKSRYTGVSFSHSGEKIAYTSTEMNGRDTDLFIQEIGGERIVVQQGQGVGWSVEDWSPDDKKILISRYVSVIESALYEVDLSTLERTRLLEEHGAISIGSVAYSESGEQVFFTSYLDGEFARIFELDLTTGAVGPRSPNIDWNVSFFRLSRDRTLLAYVVNEGGYSQTRLVDLNTKQELALPEFPLGLLSNIRFNYDDTRIAFSYQTATSQTDAYVLDVRSQELTRWTRSELGELPAEKMVSPELKQFSSFDGRQIPVFVYKPASDGPHPVLIYIHGGPESQYRPRFSATFQFYVNELGVALWVPNVRGSSGYGKEYLGLDNGYLREDSVKDIGALLDFIALDESMDASRVGVIGGSYGGYMVLASLVHFSDRLKAGVETVGISNFVTFLENTQDYRRDLRRAEYGDERDADMRAFLESIAPLNHVDQISTPLLIGQGLNDPRVPASESQQILEALQSRDVPVWYVLANDEGHGFRKKPNRDYWWYVVTMFLKEHLLSS